MKQKSVVIKPKLSIIVPVFNVEKYLPECLESIRNQTYQQWECILVNDGSTDKSGLICDSAANKDLRFTVVHQKNSGVSSARNIGIELAQGEYLSFVDPDDYISLNFYEVLLSKMKQTEAEYAVSFYCSVTEKTEKLDPINFFRLEAFKQHPAFLPNHLCVIRNFKYLKTAGCWGSVYSRRLWDGECFPLNVNLGEDLAIVPKVITKANSAIRSAETTYYYRIRKNSLLRTEITEERFFEMPERWKTDV